ncbi:hypothetical protein GCM10008171_04970 [Methylopila jiangsuensis]|uniref:2-oxo-4-hydroxy-4-carboxy-5-ureidoimidazoline decarboxylase n=2 Tax=Methylopila jiangsuensis TaxID=586230 RepID=A0A9W6JFC3_9HYPH|nr:hypothetical protein GCM10008171_04970 [Methylopila jiangsuensis]
MTVSLDDLNALDAEGVVAALDGVYEHAPWVAWEAAARRPFATVAALFAALEAAVLGAHEETRRRLLINHPPLGRRKGGSVPVAEASASEHAGAGLDDLEAQEFDRYAALNAAYQSRFGFPFVLCIRRHGKASILRQFERRLDGAPAEELATGIAEVNRIAALRLAERMTGPGPLARHGRLSTHVLDTAAGRPAAGVRIELMELGAGAPRLIADAVTNADGRVEGGLIAGRPVPIATYELLFHVGAHFRASGDGGGDPAFLDVIPVRFGVSEPEGTYHVPLTVSPFAYATYRGS